MKRQLLRLVGWTSLAVALGAGVFLSIDATAQGLGGPGLKGGGNCSGGVCTGTEFTASTNYTASGTAAQFICSATGRCTFEAATSASTMTGTVPALDLIATGTPDANDRLVCFSYGTTASPTRVFCADREGDLSAFIDMTSSSSNPTLQNSSGSTYIQLGTTVTTSIRSATPDSVTSTSVASLTLDTAVNVTDGDLLFEHNNSAGTAAYSYDEQGNATHAGNLDVQGTGSVTTCTLNGASPSTCTATVVSGATCTCSPVGATAAIAAGGCAVSLSGTTLTITAANAATHVVNIHCL